MPNLVRFEGIWQPNTVASVQGFAKAAVCHSDEGGIRWLLGGRKAATGKVQFLLRRNEKARFLARRENPEQSHCPISDNRVRLRTEKSGSEPFFASKTTFSFLARLSFPSSQWLVVSDKPTQR